MANHPETLSDIREYIHFDDDDVVLDGRFTVEQLRRILEELEKEKGKVK